MEEDEERREYVWGQRDDLVKSSYCSCRGPGFSSQSPAKQLSTAFNSREEMNTGRRGGEAGGDRGRRTTRRT